MSNVVPLHPRHRGDAEHARGIWPALSDLPLPEVREFLVRRQIALECKRRKVSSQDHNTAKRMALDALSHGASADAARRVAFRFIDAVSPRRSSTAGSFR